MTEAPDTLLSELGSYVGNRLGPVYAWDRVNEPMIRQWREALGFPAACDDANISDSSVPATMLPVWLMPGIENRPPPGSDTGDHRAIMKVLEREGFDGILGTNCEQRYERPLKIGERIASTYEVDAVSARKNTKFGPGYFITFRQTYLDEGAQEVGSMLLTILRFKPDTAATEHQHGQQAVPPQPSMNDDTRFFWEGLQERKLLIQRCTQCKTLRHPPGPVCTECHCLDWDTIESGGTGEIYSFVVVHKPQFDAFEYPHPVGLIELDEGIRLVAPLAYEDRERIAIGQRVKAEMQSQEGGHRMPVFHRIPSANP